MLLLNQGQKLQCKQCYCNSETKAQNCNISIEKNEAIEGWKKNWEKITLYKVDLFSQLLKRILHLDSIVNKSEWSNSDILRYVTFCIFSLDFESFGRSCFCRRRLWRWCRTPFGGSSWTALMWVHCNNNCCQGRSCSVKALPVYINCKRFCSIACSRPIVWCIVQLWKILVYIMF